MRKYRFKQEFRDAQIAIPGIKVLITRFNLTDDFAEMILKKYPRFSHNIEEVPVGQSADDYGAADGLRVPKKLQKYSTSQLKGETKSKPEKSVKPTKEAKGNE